MLKVSSREHTWVGARLQDSFSAACRMHRLFKVSCDIFGWPYSLIRSCTNSAYNFPNTNSKKGNRNNQSRTSVGSFSTPRLQISTLRPCKLSKGRVNSFHLFGRFPQQKPQLKSTESGVKSKQWNEWMQKKWRQARRSNGGKAVLKEESWRFRSFLGRNFKENS